MNILEKLKNYGVYFGISKAKVAVCLAFLAGILTMAVLSVDPFESSKVVVALVLCIGLSCITIELPKIWYELCVEAALVFCGATCFVVMEVINFYTLRWDWWNLLINGLPFYIIAKILYLITKKLNISVFLTLLCSYLFSLVV